MSLAGARQVSHGDYIDYRYRLSIYGAVGSLTKIATTWTVVRSIRGRHAVRSRRGPGTIRILARIRHRVTRYAIQNPPAIDAVMMKFRGDTSHDVSETIRPNACPLKISARSSSNGKPRRRRRVDVSARVS